MKLSATRARTSYLVFTAAAILTAGTVASAATLCVEPSGKHGCKATISAAVSAAALGDVIEVADGTYTEQVTITKSISLVAAPFASPVINAKDKAHGIFVNGMATLPLPGVANVIVSGFKIKNAEYEGILVANASNVTLLDNHVLDNNKALIPSSASCPNIAPYETSEQMDCGEGIHLMATDHTTVLHNHIENNSGGILITDETGPTTANIIKDNNVHDNAFACGITMASHPAANAHGATGALPYGITHNVIEHNDSHHNGLGLPGAGAGVGIFAPFPGTTSSANVVINNDLHGNGLPGVTMHNHASAPSPAPGINLNDNIIIGNRIYANAADTADAFTSGPTGINIYSTAPVTGTVISENEFRDESVDISFKAPGGYLDIHFNNFDSNGVGIDNLGSGLISATQNWWGCPSGPSSRCSKTSGPGITTAPSLFLPFNRYDHDR